MKNEAHNSNKENENKKNYDTCQYSQTDTLKLSEIQFEVAIEILIQIPHYYK